MTRIWILWLTALLLPAPAVGQSAMPPAPYANRQLPSPELEATASALMHELRCLVCAGQSIADSDAPMAGDMRSAVRTRIAAGQSPEDIRRWLIERYGSWVTYNPPMRDGTLLLWAMPVLLLLLGLWIAAGRFTRRVQSPGNTP